MTNRSNPYDPLSATERRVLYVIVDEADQRNTGKSISLYRKDIARLAGLSLRRTSEITAKLIEKEFLAAEQQFSHRGSHEATKYTILNPDRQRHQKIKLAADAAGISVATMTEYVYWLSLHRDKVASIDNPTMQDIATYAHCPVDDVQRCIVGLVTARILINTKDAGSHIEF